jgi:hypothetical protein
MSGLSKLLLVLNLLAIGAFAYFALENWKVRQEFNYVGFRNEVVQRGIPVEEPATKDTDSGSVPFVFMVNEATQLDSIPKTTLDKLIPKGDSLYGGEPVADQTAEVKRVQAKVLQLASGEGALQKLRIYLTNLARTGAERDGINALFDILDPSKSEAARRDLPYLARTSSQTAALRALVQVSDLDDPAAIVDPSARASRIKSARDAIAQFIRGEVAYGVAPGNTEDARQLTNAIDAALSTGAGASQKEAIVAAAKADAAAFGHLGDLAINPLATKTDVLAARQAIQDFILARILVPSEGEALKGIVNLISPPANADYPGTVQSTATQLLTQRFDEAALPVIAKGGKGLAVSDKARKIAHLLFHLDANRHFDANAKAEREAWHTRVATIVGLKEYVSAAEAQATELAEGAQRLIAAITEEQGAFEDQYRSLVQRSESLYSDYMTLNNQLKQQQTITAENVRLLKERETERDNLKKELENARESSKEALARLKATQDNLFKIQKDLRDAQQALFNLEKELQKLELSKAN